ncbi:gamma-glutamyltranspeptidase/glutathione hydrolase [Rhodoligotrophos appendicifer]|uniref:gamma-glutamyltransferase family protein n=1 Tax=Rhodoligotrophos appendicifer TaxID=987056 RepID=UPI001186CC5F|nr:gamma-glutamyltransferase [Rhodoligotrophos appendicifer]
MPPAQSPSLLAAHRPIVMSEHGLVVAGHPRAAEAGAAILRAGGNAMDAAIAAATTLAIAIPFMNGIGGDAIALWSDAEGRVTAINGSGATAAAATVEAFQALGHSTIPRRGPLAVSVPGVVAAWGQSLERFGTMSLAEILAPAIALAENGVPLDSTSTRFFNGPDYAALVADFPALATMFLAHGSARLGARLRQPQAAATLRILAEKGWSAFYEGALADDWIKDARAAGVLLDGGDLSRHETLFDAPLAIDWQGHRVHVAPPNSQGISLLAMLGLANQEQDAAEDGFIDPVAHLERKLTAFRIRDAYCADPRRVALPADILTAESLAALHRSTQDPVNLSGGGDTSTLVVVDEQGNAVSWVQSLFEAFGSCVTVPKHGLVLHNRAMLERLDDDPVRGLKPGHRPFHTLCPAMVTGEGGVELAISTPGDHGQPQSLLQVIRRHFEEGLDIQAAIEWPRIRHDDGRTVLVEDRCPQSWITRLEAAGWTVEHVGGWSRLMGGVNAVRRMPDGLLMGGADPRRECYAVGT